MYSMKLYLSFHRTPLHLAVLLSRIDIIQLLLEHDGIDINAIDDIFYNYI